MKEKIKLKLVFLYYDYLAYIGRRLAKRQYNIHVKMHSLEVKYMGIEPTVVDWSNLDVINELEYEETENTNSKVVTEEIS